MWKVLEISPIAFESDPAPMALPDGTVSNVSNIDFYAGTARGLPDLKILTTPPAQIPHAIQSYADTTNLHVAVCGSVGVYAWSEGGAWDDIMPATGLTGADYWDTTAFGKWLVVTSDTVGEAPHAISATVPHATTNLAPLPNWPATWECTLIRTHRNVLWAGDTIESSVAYPNRVRWSTSAATDGLPASWTPAASNDAGQADLEFTTGRVNDFAACGDVMYISGVGGLYAARWVGGQYVYNFSKILDQGARGLRCMEAIDGNNVAVLTYDDLMIVNESSSRSIAIARVVRLIRRMAKAEIMFMRSTRELVIAYAKEGETAYNNILIWDMDTNTFGTRDISAHPITCMGAGYDLNATEADTWNLSDGNWQDWNRQWDNNPKYTTLYLGGNTDGLWTGGYIDANWMLERIAMPSPDGDDLLIEGIEAEIDGQSGTSITIRCGTSEYASQAITWSDSKSFIVGEERTRSDVRLRGKYISWRLQGNKACRIVKIRFYYKTTGVKP